jgi:transposase
MRVATSIILTTVEREELAALTRPGRTSVRLALRACIVLLCAEGRQNVEIAEELGIGRIQVARWRERYAHSERASIERDLPRGAPPAKVDIARLVELTTRTKPEAVTQWSTR